jgi:hypothetical protein
VFSAIFLDKNPHQFTDDEPKWMEYKPDPHQSESYDPDPNSHQNEMDPHL